MDSKYYVVWVGREPGIYDSWSECRAQTDGFPGARFKGFNSLTEATMAFRGNPDEDASIIRSLAARGAEKKPAPVASPSLSLASPATASPLPWQRFAEVNPAAIAVDGASSGNPGRMEYRCVRLCDGKELFHMGPFDDGTNNVAEYLALVHALALLYRQGDTETPIYTDSRTARAWVRRRMHNSTLKRTERNGPVFDLLQRADVWLHLHTTRNPVLAWNTDAWGEIPADFGRK